LKFVVCNLILNDNQVKNHADNFDEDVNDFSSDDYWTIKGENHGGSSNFDLLGVVDSATQRENGKKDESDEEEISNDIEMESHGIGHDLDIQVDVKLKNSRSSELNIIDNIGIGIDNTINVQNIGVYISSNTNNTLNGNDLDRCMNVLGIMRKNKVLMLVSVYMIHLQIICFRLVDC